MPLVEYSDSEDEIEDVPATKRLKTKHTELPALPSDFLDLYSSTVRCSVQDDPILHGGRKRTIPHAEGNWPSHVYLEWHPDEDELEILSTIIERTSTSNHETEIHSLLRNDLGVVLPLHISLSRPLVLKTEQKELFLQKVQQNVRGSGVQAFIAQSSSIQWHPNEDGSRHFLVMQTRSNNEELGTLLARCNQIAVEFGQPELYARRGDDIQRHENTDSELQRSDQFHISLAWTLPHPGNQAVTAVEERLPANMMQQLKSLQLSFSAVKIRVGQDVTTVQLATTRK